MVVEILALYVLKNAIPVCHVAISSSHQNNNNNNSLIKLNML